MLKKFTKVSNISNLSVARYCAGMFVDLLSFNVNESNDNFIELAKYQEIRGWIAGCKIVIESDLQDVEELTTLIEKYQPDYLQTSHFSVLELKLPIKYIFSGNSADLDFIPNAMYDYFQINGFPNNVLDDFDIFSSDFSSKLILNGENSEKFIVQNIDNPKFLGFNFNSTKEKRPGYQDFDDLIEKLELLDE